MGGSAIYLVSQGTTFRSDDYGDSWNEIGLIAEQSSRAEIVGSEAGAPRLYAALYFRSDGRRTALYRSDDAGLTWSFMHDVVDYWQTLNASIVDADRVAWGGVEVHLSRDGGETFDIVNSWGEYYSDPVTKLHADIPGIDVVLTPQGEEIWYIDTDGGLYRSFDGMDSVENLSLQGLRVSQYYSTLTSKNAPYPVAAGAQDQGYQISYLQQPNEQYDFEQWISGITAI